MNRRRFTDLPEGMIANIIANPEFPLGVQDLFWIGVVTPDYIRLIREQYAARFSESIIVVLRPGYGYPGDDVVHIENYIFVEGANWLQYIRMFHAYIMNLEIRYERAAIREAEAINQLVATECTELWQVTLHGWNTQMSFDSFGTPLEVGLLKLENSHVRDSDNVAQYFPNVGRLNVDNSSVPAGFFPRLRQLFISSEHQGLEEFAPLWERHGLLRYLGIKLRRAVRFASVVSSTANNPLLDTLDIVAPAPARELHRWNVIRQFVQEHGQLVKLGTRSFFDPEQAEHLMQGLVSLEVFQYSIRDPFNNTGRLPILPPGWLIASQISDVVVLQRT